MPMLLPQSDRSYPDNAVSVDEGNGELHHYQAVLMLHALVAAGRQKKGEYEAQEPQLKGRRLSRLV